MASSDHTETPGLQPAAFAQLLLTEALVSAEQIADAQRQEIPLLAALLRLQACEALTVAELLSRRLQWPLLDLDAFAIDPVLLHEPPSPALLARQLLPLRRRGDELSVALADPTNVLDAEEAGASLRYVVVEHDKLQAALQQHAAAQRSQTVTTATRLSPMPARSSWDSDDAPVIGYIDRILDAAVAAGASDVHFEPYEQQYRIRQRKDGVLRTVAIPPLTMAPRLAARLKVMAGLDLAERRIPQDGRIAFRANRGNAVDLRVSSCPTLHGEKICCRILDPGSMPLAIDALGYDDQQRARYLQALAQPQGLILVTGPTGSGKTVSLYAGLRHLNTEMRNISTAEDPAEITLPGINQVNIHPKAGLTFATALRAFLRQDPDVIMVGEIRDLETAEIAIKAAQTGHLVLSTLHTNDATQTVVRLLNMGVPAYNLASTLSLIIAQRLARTLCPHCRRRLQLPRSELLRQGFDAADIDAPGFVIFEAAGCTRCDQGYAGRTGIFQVLPFSEAMGQLLMSGASALDLAAQATRENVASLRRAALRKVAAGSIDLAQAYACTVGD